MLQVHHLLLGVAFATCAASATATTAAVDSDYFIGNWENSPEQQCGSESAEYILFNKNGTFEYGRHGVAHGVGFWEAHDDSIVFDILVSPASFQDIINELKDSTGREAWSMRLIPVETKDSQFTAVFGFGEQLRSLTWQRCNQ